MLQPSSSTSIHHRPPSPGRLPPPSSSSSSSDGGDAGWWRSPEQRWNINPAELQRQHPPFGGAAPPAAFTSSSLLSGFKRAKPLSSLAESSKHENSFKFRLFVSFWPLNPSEIFRFLSNPEATCSPPPPPLPRPPASPGRFNTRDEDSPAGSSLGRDVQDLVSSSQMQLQRLHLWTSRLQIPAS